MKSRFAKLVEQRGAPLIKEALGEREDDGSYGTIFFSMPNVSRRMLTDVIISPIMTAMVLDDRTGNVQKKETVTVRVPRSENELPFSILHKARFTLPSIDDREWIAQTDGCSAGSFFNVYALERKPLANFNEKRDAPIR